MRTMLIVVLLTVAMLTHAQVVIDGGELGTFTIPTRVIPATKVLLDAFNPPAVDDETGEIIPKTAAQYKADVKQWIRQRGWVNLKAAVLRQLNAERPPANVDDMTGS